MDDLTSILDAIQATGSLDELSLLLKALCEPLEAAHLVYHAIPIAQELSVPTLLLTYDQSWVGRYFEERYFEIDPVVAAGRRAFLPLDWAELERRGSAVTDFFKDSLRFGVGQQGLTLPIRGPRGQRALFTINCRASDREWPERRLRILSRAHVIGHFLHARAMDLVGTSDCSLPRLSRREVQCLSAALKGKMHKATAYDLGLSESAVQLYLRSARTKLKCATLAQAVAKALMLELIEAT